METQTLDTTVQQNGNSPTETTLPPQVDTIMAIAKRVEAECHGNFEIVFKAIVDAIYIGNRY